MKKDKTKQKKKPLRLLYAALFGMVCGIILILSGYEPKSLVSLLKMLLQFAGIVLLCYFAEFLQIIIHEAGHLIAGLCTGYKFLSFRILSFMWIKEDEKIKLRKYSLAGTGGQCLMTPPDIKDGKFPFLLYNLGGSLFNLAFAIIFGALYHLFNDIAFLSLFLLFMCITGAVSALTNAIPLRLHNFNNDGYNALEMYKSPEAMKIIWIRLKFNEQRQRGARFNDMPNGWFYLPEESAMKYSIVSDFAAFYLSRLIDEHKFAEFEALADKLLNGKTGILGINRSLLICDRIYCELIGNKNNEIIENLYNKKQIKFMEQIKSNPTVIRTKYAYTLLFENDIENASKIKEKFEKTAKTYPYQGDIELDRELIEIANKQKVNGSAEERV